MIDGPHYFYQKDIVEHQYVQVPRLVTRGLSPLFVHDIHFAPTAQSISAPKGGAPPVVFAGSM